MKKLAAQFFEHNLPLQELLQNFWSSWTAVFFAQLSLTQTWTKQYEKIGSPVFRAQPSFTGTVAKILVQLNPSFLHAALPHRNLDGKIGQPSFSGAIFSSRTCLENFWSNSVPSFSRAALPHRILDGKFGPAWRSGNGAHGFKVVGGNFIYAQNKKNKTHWRKKTAGEKKTWSAKTGGWPGANFFPKLWHRGKEIWAESRQVLAQNIVEGTCGLPI